MNFSHTSNGRGLPLRNILVAWGYTKLPEIPKDYMVVSEMRGPFSEVPMIMRTIVNWGA